jgi:peptidoglycan/LPS O-acetylase OafA/YrhL
MLRSLAAIVGGYIAYAFLMGFTVLVLQTVLPTAFGAADASPREAWAMAIEIAYSIVFAILAGYVTALIARRAGIAHAAILAAIVLLISVVSLVAAPEANPLWYNATLTLLSSAAVVVGGMLRARQTTAVVI